MWGFFVFKSEREGFFLFHTLVLLRINGKAIIYYILLSKGKSTGPCKGIISLTRCTPSYNILKSDL